VARPPNPHNPFREAIIRNIILTQDNCNNLAVDLSAVFCSRSSGPAAKPAQSLQGAISKNNYLTQN
jgi:hypothetical protein